MFDAASFFRVGSDCKLLRMSDFIDGIVCKYIAISFFHEYHILLKFVKRGRVLRVTSVLGFAHHGSGVVRAWFGHGSGFVSFSVFSILNHFLAHCGSGVVRARFGHGSGAVRFCSFCSKNDISANF